MPYVVTSPSAPGTVALVSPVTTWQAYNAWGGYSLYEGPSGDRESWAVSFDRPYNGATGANDYRTAAIPVIVRAERTGEPLSYFTNVDLHTRPGSLDGARGYVSMGHDEYWTPTMRAEVMRARDAGTNLAFLGANTMYWRVRLEDRPTGSARVVVGYRNSAHLDPWRDVRPAEATSRFRDAPVARPEHDLLGVQYECYPVDVDLVVASPRWWGFRGTGVRRGDRVPGLIGPEADRVYPDDRLPRPLEVLGHTPYECRGVATTRPDGLLHGRLGGRGVHRRDPALGLRPGGPVRAAARRPDGRLRRRRDRQPGPRLRAGPGRAGAPGPGQRRATSTSRPRTRCRRVETAATVIGHHGWHGPPTTSCRVRRRRRSWPRPCSPGAARPTPPDPTSPPQPQPALAVETVSGAGDLAQETRTELETEVGGVLSDYVVEAFLGDFPREEFVQAFGSFTSGAARSAAGDIEQLTAARVQDATAVTATRLDARLSFLVAASDVRRRHRGPGPRVRRDDARRLHPTAVAPRAVPPRAGRRGLGRLRVRRRARRRLARSRRR